MNVNKIIKELDKKPKEKDIDRTHKKFLNGDGKDEL